MKPELIAVVLIAVVTEALNRGESLMNTAQYEAHLWTQMMQTMGLLLIIYLPLQIGAVLTVRHWLARLAAGLPIVLMLPLIVTGSQTKTYEDGSLYGIGLMVVSVPVMAYLAAFFFAGLAGRAARKTTPESDQTNDSGSKRLPVVLLTLAVLFGLGVLVCFLVLVPR